MPSSAVWLALAGEAGVDRGEPLEVGQPPGLGSVGQVTVGEQDHRRAVLDGDADRLDRHLEAVGGRPGRQHRQRSLPVAPVDGVEQVGLLGLGGEAGRRAAPLHVHDDQGQLEVDGEADGLGLEVESRAAGGGHPEGAAEGGAQGRADAGDLVLGLEGPDAELLSPGELVEDVGCRGDRVAPQKQGKAGQPGGGDQSPGEGLVAGDLDVLTLLERGGAHLVVRLEELRRLAEVVAGPERPGVGLGHRRPVGEALGDPLEGRGRSGGCTASSPGRGRRSSWSARRPGA